MLWHPTPVLLPGESHGRRSLVGCSPWGLKEPDTTEQLHFHFSLSCIGEGNGNPLQCSCLENPRDGETGGLPSMGSHGVGHGWHDLAAAGKCFDCWFKDSGTVISRYWGFNVLCYLGLTLDALYMMLSHSWWWEEANCEWRLKIWGWESRDQALQFLQW